MRTITGSTLKYSATPAHTPAMWPCSGRRRSWRGPGGLAGSNGGGGGGGDAPEGSAEAEVSMDPASAGTPPLTIGDHPEGSHASGSGPGKPPMPYARVAWDHLGQMATPARPDIRRSLRARTSVGEGKSVSVSVNLVGRRTFKKKTY